MHRSFEKPIRIESRTIRGAAEGEDCTLNIAAVCNYDVATTVLCHLPDESHGTGKKSDDISAAFGCSACHDCIDGRHTKKLNPFEIAFYGRRGQTRTLRRLFERGLLKIKGEQHVV